MQHRNHNNATALFGDLSAEPGVRFPTLRTRVPGDTVSSTDQAADSKGGSSRIIPTNQYRYAKS